MEKAEYDSRYLFNYDEVAEITGREVNTVRRWGLESVAMDGRKKLFYIGDVFNVLEGGVKDRGNLTKERTRKEKEMADKLAMENEEMRNSLISAEDANRIWDRIVETSTTKIMALSVRTPDILAKSCTVQFSPDDMIRIEAALVAEYKAALSELSRGYI